MSTMNPEFLIAMVKFLTGGKKIPKGKAVETVLTDSAGNVLYKITISKPEKN